MVSDRIGIGQTRTSSKPWKKPSDYHRQWFVINITYVLFCLIALVYICITIE